MQVEIRKALRGPHVGQFNIFVVVENKEAVFLMTSDTTLNDCWDKITKEIELQIPT